jgi:hypothetical protein
MKLIEFRPNGHTITLNILGERWEGISYRCNGVPTMYLIGELPQVWTYPERVRFRINFRDWYVAAYMDHFDSLSDQVKTFHPFGNNWILVSRQGGREYPTIPGHIE